MRERPLIFAALILAACATERPALTAPPRRVRPPPPRPAVRARRRRPPPRVIRLVGHDIQKHRAAPDLMAIRGPTCWRPGPMRRSVPAQRALVRRARGVVAKLRARAVLATMLARRSAKHRDPDQRDRDRAAATTLLRAAAAHPKAPAEVLCAAAGWLPHARRHLARLLTRFPRHRLAAWAKVRLAHEHMLYAPLAQVARSLAALRGLSRRWAPVAELLRAWLAFYRGRVSHAFAQAAALYRRAQFSRIAGGAFAPRNAAVHFAAHTPHRPLAAAHRIHPPADRKPKQVALTLELLAAAYAARGQTDRVLAANLAKAGLAGVSRRNRAWAETQVRLARQQLAGPQSSPSAPLRRKEVRRWIVTYSAQVEDCYAQALIRHPALQGPLILRIRLDRGGKVLAASTSGSTARLLGACVRRRVRRWRLPASRDAPLDIIYPYRLKLLR